MSCPSSSHHLLHSLQLAVQNLQWTYSLFWHLNPQQGVLEWGDGYYNGTIKTRKTVQPMEVSTEDVALQRSRQLRELYEALSAGETNPPARRPCAALSPEDLTETEWFYLMCVSFSFPPGLGLPGKAFGSQRHVWLTRANETDSKTFSRAILAKVEEDLGLIQHVKDFFLDNSISNLEQQQQPLFNFQDLTIVPPMSAEPESSNRGGDEDEGEDEDDEHDDDEEDDNMDDETEAITDSEAMAGRFKSASLAPMVISEPSELMQLDMSEEIRLGSPDECSDNLDSELQILGKHYDHPNQSDTYQAWQQLHEDICNSLVQPSGTPQTEEIAQEDANYSETVVTILSHNSSRVTGYGVTGCLAHSKQSAFREWKCNSEHRYTCLSSVTRRSQLLLKYILFNVPKLHMRPGGSRLLKGTQQEELSANHVLAERRRREKLNERFIILRSLVPCVTKMDKASILGDTIEYVKQLRKRIQDLESRNKKMESDWRSKEHNVQVQANSSSSHSSVLPEKRKLRMMEVEGGNGKSARVVASTGTNLQVSISGTDALLNFQCAYRDGLMAKIMQTLDELQLEVTSVQSSVTDGVFAAEMRAKVRDRETNGKKASILEVKKAMHQIFNQY
ncbi:putative transcription factor bHLH family [Dioscorea sansibarensis]